MYDFLDFEIYSDDINRLGNDYVKEIFTGYNLPNVINCNFNISLVNGQVEYGTCKLTKLNPDIMDSVEYENDDFVYENKSTFKEAEIVVTPINDIPDIKKLVNSGQVTYRGLGLGKVANDFHKMTGESGLKIKIKGKEYFITSSDFDKLGGVSKIKFQAPSRKLT